MTLYENIGMIEGIEYYKVMEYTEDEAEVLCVSKGHGSTNLCKYKKKRKFMVFRLRVLQVREALLFCPKMKRPMHEYEPLSIKF